MFEFHHLYIKNKHINVYKLLFQDTNSLMYEIELKIYKKILGGIKKCLILVAINISQNTRMIQTNYSMKKRQEEVIAVTIEVFVAWKPRYIHIWWTTKTYC